MMGALRKLAVPISLALCLALQIWLYGFSTRATLGFCGVMVVLAFSDAFAEQIGQPWRNYAIVVTVSAFVGLFLFDLLLNPLALAFWLLCTVMALFWAWYWEWTEPLPSSPE